MIGEWLLVAGIGILATVAGLFGLYLSFFGSYEELEPPIGWGEPVGIGTFETRRSRQTIWFVIGTVALATGIAIFAAMATTL